VHLAPAHGHHRSIAIGVAV
jgi:hypothetical protein